MKAKLHYVLSIAMFLAIFSVSSQNSSWNKKQTIKNSKIISKLNLDKSKVHVFELNTVSLKKSLLGTVSRNSKTKQKSTTISIPGNEGKLETFKIYEASVFSPDLAAKYSDIKSYIGVSTNNSGTRLRMSMSPLGIQTMITYINNTTVFMQPTSQGSNEYVLYNKNSKDFTKNRFECKTFEDVNKSLNKNSSNSKIAVNEGGANNQTLQKFRIAISTTAEYTAYHNDGIPGNGDAVADALAAINATLNRVNEIFETDMAVTFELINAPQLIYTNTSTDPYSNASIGTHEDNKNNTNGWSLQLQNNLTNTIGNAAYDIGHLFGATGGGGNAGCIGCVCTNDDVLNNNDKNKGSAFTSPANAVPEGDTFDIDFVAHEIGHQMGASHTFAYETEGSGVNSEPGSGTTIMAYAGIEGNNNVALNSDPYFHYHSIKQILENLRFKTCQTTEVITNNSPIANAGANFNIPAGTAYVLKGTATDADGGDNLTYCWEQIDSGSVNYLNFGPDLTSGSMNRSLPPSSDSNRYIPKLSSVLAGNTTQTNPTIISDWETVSTVGRNLNWALTVRDRAPASASGGQSSFDTMKITVEAVSPFTVSNPVSWAQGSNVIINWEVGQTTNASINCQTVNIKLSTDGGLTFPIIVASNTPNDGTHAYTVPSIPDTNTARLLVEAADNIFYDVSNFDFSISPTPDFFIVEDILDPIVCAATTATFHFNYVVANGFSENTVFSVTNLPSGASAIFSPTQLANSGTVTMTINNISTQGNYTPNIIGTSASITKNKNVNLPFFNGICNSIANTEYETSTTLVQFNTINNASGKTSGYNDYKNISTSVNRNSIHNLTVKVNTDGDFSTSTKVWIDWNQNCSFNDAGEEYNLGDATNVSNGSTSNSPLSITIPADASFGNTIMRVSTKFRDDGVPTACENGFDGEVEDYTLNIVSEQVTISLVKFNTIDNTSTVSSGYNDYKSISTPVNRNSSYPLNVNVNTNGNFETSIKVWIDWNQNSSFEDSEEVYDLGNTTNVANGPTANSPLSITVPMNALLGTTTMRVSIKYGDGSFHTSEENIINGEVEDYSLNIIPTETIEAFGFENLRIFPNPNEGAFTIKLNGSLERNIDVKMFDIRGRYIFNKSFQNAGDFREELQLYNLQPGMYLLIVNDGVRKIAKNIVIK
ncbi:reprolysin-like metallopeptidase [Mariniflexile litorale]|uniref:Reprolysin-like metallopeptidase n=1 Tax=Mariniflexile litorale TaxID=3045158 RepID=A0AAU7EL63_9FLAO|nr:GEVED domain-containing protein [Mariniflexile sp. KMM 9835]MDQ8213282.1 GEVED domain-containing protein [Mariniflexile sp. KMM 9835]